MAGRFFIAIGSPECPRLGLRPLARVAGDVERVTRLLTTPPQNFERVLAAELPLGASSDSIEKTLSEWFANSERLPDDVVVIYLAGHGDSFGRFRDHCLLTSDSINDRVDTVVRTADLVRWIFSGRTSPENVLLILDVCYAGQGAGESMVEALKVQRGFPNGTGFWAVVSSDQNTEAGDGAFVSAWLQAMSDEAWVPRGGAEFLSPSDLAAAINEHLAESSQQRAIPYGVGGPLQPQFIRNPNFTQQWDGLSIDDQAHWAPKARGVDTASAPGWFFTGRQEILRTLWAWLVAGESDGRARVVTGDPGSGKSAVLGWLVLAAQGKVPGGALPAGLPPIVSVHARGARVREVAETLSGRLGGTASDVPALIQELLARESPVGIIIDSLDEAAEPVALDRKLVRELAACPMVRLIVGRRRSQSGSPQVLLDLDTPRFFSEGDLENYVWARLTSRQGIPAAYADPGKHEPARSIAKLIARRAGHSFLYARVVSRTFADGEVVDTALADWESRLALPVDLQDAFHADWERFDLTTRKRFQDLLIPLAYSVGRGIPQKMLWATLASRVAGQTYTNADIRDLKERAGFYLVQDTWNGEVVFRLFHQAFAEYLKKLTRDEDVERSMAEALRDLVPSEGMVKAWDRVQEPYLLHAFPRHAAAGGLLAEEMSHAEFLLHIPPEALLPQLAKISDGSAWGYAQAYRKAAHWLRKGEAMIRRQYLRWAALEYHVHPLVAALSPGVDGSASAAWWPVWARWRSGTSSYVVGECREKITALGIYSGSADETIAVAGCEDGMLQVWHVEETRSLFSLRPSDLRDDEIFGTPVFAVAMTDCIGRKIVVAAWGDASLRVIEPETATVIATWRKGKSWNRIPKLTILPQGQQSLVALADLHDLYLFELPSLQIKTVRLGAVAASIYSLTPILWKDRLCLLSGGDTMSSGEECEEFPLRIWNLENLETICAVGSGITLARECHVTTIGGVPHVILREGGGDIVCRSGEDLREVARVGGVYSPVEAVLVDEGKTVILTGYGQLLAYKAELIPEPESSSPNRDPRKVRLIPLRQPVDFSGACSTEIVWMRGRPVIARADGKGIRIWDLRDLLDPTVHPAKEGVPNFDEDPLRALVGEDNIVVAGTHYGKLWAWKKNGLLLWKRDVSGWVVCLQVAKTGGETELLVGLMKGEILRLDMSTGGELRPAIKAGDELFALDVESWEERPHLLVAIRLNGLYFARVWDLTSDAEIQTWTSDLGPEGAQDWHTGRWERGGVFEPGLALVGYYQSKTLEAVSALAIAGRTLVAVGGPHGEVRVVDLAELTETAEWTGGKEQDYLKVLLAVVLEGTPLVFGGDEKGRLFRGGALTGQREVISVKDAHADWTKALLVKATPSGAVLVSGGYDGMVRFWTIALQPLMSIEAGRPVYALAWGGDSELLIGTDRGVMNVRLDWAKVFATEAG